MAEDVTEQRELEERLRQSQKLEAIGRLAGGVAHDFNNMLTAIGGYNALALEHATTGSALHEDLEEIRKATDRAALLTRQLLAFSRKQILQPELLNLNGIVVDMQSMLQAADRRGRHPGDRPGSRARPDRGRSGAAPAGADEPRRQRAGRHAGRRHAHDRDPERATCPRTIRDHARALHHARRARQRPRDRRGHAGADLRAVLHDEGVGQGNRSRPGDRVRHREAERRLRRSRQRGGRGHGLHDLPASRRRVARAARRGGARAGPGARSTSPATVLVVEDEEIVRRLVCQVLEQAGYEVVEAADGAEALEVAGSRRVDLLLDGHDHARADRTRGRRAAPHRVTPS